MMRLLGRTSSIVKQSIRQSASSHSPLNPLTASLSKFRSPNETPPSTDPTSRSQISDVSRSPPPRRYTPKVLVKAYVKPLSGESFVKDPQLSQLSVALSAGREDIDVNLLLGLVRDTYNSLKNLDPNLNLLVFNCLQNLNLCSKLRLSDWHRLLQNMIPWADENDPLDKNSLPKEPVPTAIRKGAIQALLEMKRSGIIPDAFVYTALCRAVRDDVRQVFQVYDAARAQFNAGFSRPGSKVISNKLFETFLVILSGRIQAKRMHQLVHDIWDDLRTAQIEQSSHLCLLILQRGMLDPSQINFVSDIHQKLRWRKGALKEKWTVEYYETLMRTYIRMGSNNAVDRLFTELREDGLPASRACFSYFLMSLYNKGRHSVALSVQKSMENSRSSFAFEDASLVSLLEHSLVLNNHENVKHLYKISKRYTDDKTLTHSPPLITSTAYRSFISAFSRFNIKDLGQTAFATYVRLRLKEANEHNAKHSLTRTLASVGPSQSKGDWVNSFRAFVPPEPPRNVLSSMASLLGRMQDREQIVPFFKTHVFQPERLATYRIHTTNKARAEIQTAIETTTKEIKLWENCSKEERNATAGHGRYLNRKLASLKEQQKAKRTEWTHITGREGPLAVVYEALRKGWTDALMEGAPNDAHKAANLMDLEAVIQELTDMESQVLDSLP